MEQRPHLNSMEKLASIASALGAERTRLEFIPFLTEIIQDRHGVFLSLAAQLGQCTSECFHERILLVDSLQRFHVLLHFLYKFVMLYEPIYISFRFNRWTIICGVINSTIGKIGHY